MGIVPIGKGGVMPDPKPGEEYRPRVSDDVDEVERAVVRGHRIRAFLQASGQDAGARAPAKPDLDVGAFLKAQTDLVSTLIGQAQTNANHHPNDPFYQHLEKDLRETKDRLDAAGSVDPLETLERTEETLARLAESLKKRMGVTSQGPPTITDISGLMKLEEMKIEHQERMEQMREDRAERQRQWEAEDKQRDRQWEREQKRWELEFGLKREESRDGRHMREEGLGGLTKLFTSLGKSVKMSTGQDEPGGQIAQVAARPTSHVLPCVQCQGEIAVQEDATEVRCPHCRKLYDLLAGQDGRQQAEPERVAVGSQDEQEDPEE